MQRYIRSLLRQKLHSSVIIVSLALGLACISLIGVFLNREMGADGFHADKDRMYALQSEDLWRVGGKMYHCKEGAAEYMQNNFSQVEAFCRLLYTGSYNVKVNGNIYSDNNINLAASGNFFDFFSYQLLSKNHKVALETENHIVISETLANKYFGAMNPMGKELVLLRNGEERNMVVNGVFRKPKAPTQLKFDMVTLNKGGDSRCYVKLGNGAGKLEVESLFLTNKEKIPIIHGGSPGAYYLKPLKEAYFDTSRRYAIENSRNKADLYVAGVIGGLILMIAVFNFLGLLNNKLIEKKRDMAIERINGSSRMALVRNFMLENLFLVFAAYLFSIVLSLIVAPFFNELTNSNIGMGTLFSGPSFFVQIALLLFIVLTILVFVSLKVGDGFDIKVLKSRLSLEGKGLGIPVFNMFQLAVSIAMIISTLFVIKQIKYISDKPIGMDKRVLGLMLPPQKAGQVTVFKEELLRFPFVKEVSITNASPVKEHFILLLKHNVYGSDQEYYPSGFSGDEHYLSSLGIKFLKGENFSDSPTANQNKIIINNTLADLFPDMNLIGKGLPGMMNNIVIGVVEDFHYDDLKSVVGPAYVGYSNTGRGLMVKPVEGKEKETRDAIAAVWAKLIPEEPMNCESVGERYQLMHAENQKYIRLISACSAISIFLSMIGLFAVSHQNMQYKIKEIGVRKVNGAKVYELIAQLNKNLTVWTFIAFIIAAPLAYVIMQKWLENFAYRTSVNVWVVALAGLIALLISVFTVSGQTYKAASRNPIKALRYE